MKRKKYEEGTPIKCSDGEVREVIYRETAIAKGLNRFFTGKPCRYGHKHERKVSGYICVMCARERQKERHKRLMKDDPEYRRRFLDNRNRRHHERYESEPEYRQKFLDRAKDAREKVRYSKVSR